MSRLTVRPAAHGVVVLTLDAPDRRNALDLPTMQDLVARLRAADGDDEVRAIVLTGADPAFCAGLDLAAVSAGELVLEEVESLDADPWKTLQELSTPTIAAVNGPAVTGGLELALCCDLAVASPQARFADTHARVGIHPSGGLSVLLPRFVGLRTALGMSLTGRFVAADEALALGLVNAVVEHDELLRTALSLGEAIGETDPVVVRTLLQTYRQLSGVPLADALAQERRRGRSLTVDAEAVERRRAAVIERGRRQL
ncbi:enoyl-CoA hydratase [Egicoccus halophilus]|uniref:Putative enoyl-CoA hydratase n=1 Tax=Egicoccus halophilus TaxID=1670830 RepID=A0A8J3AAG1_9ACTN|nr:enoyl-CoA hydratase [Egicoccus halophilus]GGI02900.1 putative enoyl-CoA hydratase [Egicoccus halophilus]